MGKEEEESVDDFIKSLGVPETTAELWEAFDRATKKFLGKTMRWSKVYEPNLSEKKKLKRWKREMLCLTIYELATKMQKASHAMAEAELKSLESAYAELTGRVDVLETKTKRKEVDLVVTEEKFNVSALRITPRVGLQPVIELERSGPDQNGHDQINGLIRIDGLADIKLTIKINMHEEMRFHAREDKVGGRKWGTES